MAEYIHPADLPATFGGEGWAQRPDSHREDIRCGVVWRRCGSNSETAPLLDVALALPHAEWFPGGDPRDYLLWSWPDAVRLRRQSASIAEFYESRGVTVHWVDPGPQAPPNFLFQRDLFFMTPEGAVLARPAALQRAAEPRLAAAALAAWGVPILALPRGNATFEGADALWLDPSTVLIGTGIRTNSSGVRFVSAVLREMGVETVPAPLEGRIQHLLGAVNLAASDLAIVRRGRAGSHLAGILREFRYEVAWCEPGAEVAERLGMNFVALAPRQVVMPAGCPALRAILTGAGVAVEELDVSEYRRAAGALGCLTGIVRRGTRGLNE